MKKLQHVNADYIRALAGRRVPRPGQPFLTRGDARASTRCAPLAPLVQERVRLLTEVEPMIAFLSTTPS